MCEEPNSSVAPSPQVEPTWPKVAARDVFLTWEKWLRPAYNLVLAGVAGLVMLHFTAMGFPFPHTDTAIFYFVSRIIAANLLFTAGPLADLYITVLLGRRSAVSTGALFAIGTLFSVMLVPISLSWFWSTQSAGFRAFD